MDAFALLYERYERPLFSYLYHMARNRHWAEDLVQETFLKMLRGLKDYRPSGRFSSWLFRIARNLCIDSSRLAYRKGEIPFSAGDGPGDSESGDTWAESFGDERYRPDRLTRDREIRAAIESAVAELPREQREVFTLREYAGLSFKEIAEVTKCSVNTALGRMHYAMAKLRRALAGYEF